MFNHTSDKGAKDGRFQNGGKRLARRAERDNFKRFIMPALYIVGVLGWAVFLMTLLFASLTGTEASDYTVIAAGPTILVGLLETYRFMRGHHSEALDEP
jgi:drug/metabolite transporter (DMT)-like permease